MARRNGNAQALPVASSGPLTCYCLATRLAAGARLQTKGSLKMSNFLIANTEIATIDDEPRVRDIDLANWLGFNRAADIRELIARNRDELEAYGSFPCRTENPGKQGGRPGKAYYLNEGQALVICALSRTDKAAQVRKALIDVFMAYRQGKIVDVKAHYRRKPRKSEEKLDNLDLYLNGLLAFKNKPEAVLQIIAGLMSRVDALEKA